MDPGVEAFVALLMGFPLILGGAELFTNAIEHVAMRLAVSEGVAGSLLAAVGTALPETAVPVLASFGQAHGSRPEVAVGAVFGAPLMLSTLTFGLMAFFAGRARGFGARLQPERSGLRRDLNWFLCVFALATAGLFVPPGDDRRVLALILVGAYALYAARTVAASAALLESGHGSRAHMPLHLARGLFRPWPGLHYLQLLIGLVLILGGAELFVGGVEGVGAQLHWPVLILSLVVVPIATELPEKINSILWIRRRHDTLAFGNITGALVFQGSLLPALGLTLTPWRPTPVLLAVVAATLAAAAWLRWHVRGKRPLRLWIFSANALLYAAIMVYFIRS
ncbi:MAG: sodium:calcium antiporter [Gammaproteobacteria bacterium]|nr:sodium:calcium antiporter [Gammaproteobacteria bacterium]